MISLWTRDASAIVGLLPFLQSYRGRIILHLPAPRYESITAAASKAALKVGEIATSGRLILWSGGWCGAALCLLTAAEAEWELRWSLTNETDSGLEQLFGSTVHGFFPAAPTAAQAEHLGRSRGIDVVGGYRRGTTPGEVTRELLVFARGQWNSRQTRQIVCQEMERVLSGNAGADNSPAELVHLVVRQKDIAAPCLLVANPEAAADRLYQWVSKISLPGRAAAGGTVAPPPGVLGGIEETDLTAALFLMAPVAIRRRSDNLHSSRGVAPILTALSLLERETAGSATTELRVLDFQGITDGFFMVEAAHGLTARTIAGRPLQIHTAGGTTALQRRAGGYLKRGAPVPEITYLTTRGASWHAGTHHRGVVEYSDLGDAAALQLGTLTIDHKTALYFPWVFTLPPADDPSDAGVRALRALSFNLSGVDAASTLELQIYDFTGSSTVTAVPPGPGSTVVTGATLRVPAGNGNTLLIGGADPGNRVILPWLIERATGQEGFSLSLIYAADDHHGDAEGCSLSGTFTICSGETPLDELHLDYVAAELLIPFNRTVPEKRGDRSAPV